MCELDQLQLSRVSAQPANQDGKAIVETEEEALALSVMDMTLLIVSSNALELGGLIESLSETQSTPLPQL